MGLFRRKEKQYTLSEAMKILAKEGYESYMPVPVNPGDSNTKYWIKEEETVKQQMGVTNAILKTKGEAPTFTQKRNRFMNEVNGDGAYRKLSHDIHESNSSKQGRVVSSYNNWQSAKKYNQGNRYGQYR